MKKVKGFFGKIVNLVKKMFSSTKSTIVSIFAIFVIVILISGAVTNKRETDERQKALDEARAREAEEEALREPEIEFYGSDSYLIESQPDLVQSYGPVPDGYIWDFDGTLLSLGDKNMTAEEVVYAYFNGIRSLDFSMAQKYSRNSRVVATYQDYFASNQSTDYYDSFLRNMYKEVLLSIQVNGVTDVSVFADNKQVFTVELTILDLQNKDFWLQDKDVIFNNLYIYSLDESDSAKSETYLYDYVLNYYKSSSVQLRNVTVNITVEKYQDLDTGWLVSSDSDLDDICKYKDGNLTVAYIQEQFRDYGREQIINERNEATATEELTEEIIDENTEE